MNELKVDAPGGTAEVSAKGGRSTEVIQFLHANAYTPGCYLRMFKELGDYDIIAPEQRPLWPDQSPDQLKSWDLLADDIINHMDKMRRKGVIGIGHSMGGVASWLAAVRRPDLFSRLILIDPVVLPNSFTLGIRWLPYKLKMKLLPMIKIASRRRDTWDSREEARDYFLSKRIFKAFDEDVLEDFVQYGLKEKDSGQITLAYPRAWEAKVYATPGYLWSKMNKVQCPIAIIRAEHSNVITDDRWQKIKSKVDGGTFIEMKGAGHLFPFDAPVACAEAIKGILKN